MSATNIIILNKETTDELVKDTIICMGKNLLLNKRFNIGKLPDLNEYTKLKAFNRILTDEHCALECHFETIRQNLNRILNKYK